MALQPKFNNFTFLQQHEVEVLRRIMVISNQDGAYSDVVEGMRLREKYSKHWNGRGNFDVFVDAGLITSEIRRTSAGYRLFLKLDVAKILHLQRLISKTEHFGFFGTEKDIIRIINLAVENGGLVRAKDNYMLLSKYKSLITHMDEERDQPLLYRFITGERNSYYYAPTQRGLVIHEAWVELSNFMNECFKLNGKSWSRVL